MSSYFIGGAPNFGGGAASFPLLAPNGTAAAPSYSFTSATGTGWYYDTVNSALASSIGGTENLYLSSTFAAFPTPILTTGASQLIDGGAKVSIKGVTGVASGNAYYAMEDSTGSTVAYFGCVNGSAFVGTYTSNIMSIRVGNTSTATCNTSGQWANWKWNTVAQTSSFSPTASSSGSIYLNTGASSSITLTLPTAAQGLSYRVVCTAAQNIVISGAGNVVTANLTSGTSRTLLGSATQFTSCTVVCYDGTNWVLTDCVGSIS